MTEAWISDDGVLNIRSRIRHHIVDEVGARGEQPTDDEIRRTVDSVLRTYRQGATDEANRVSGAVSARTGRGRGTVGTIVASALLAVFATVGVLAFLPNIHLELKVPTFTFCQSPAPYARFVGIHESGDSEWKVPVDTCS